MYISINEWGDFILDDLKNGALYIGTIPSSMDNLIADKKCVPMIIVASSGYAFKDNEYPVFFPGDFDSELVNSIIPYVEENFKVKKGDNESWTSCRHRFLNFMCGTQ